MDRDEAFRTLSLHESADGSMVQTAYWALVRRAQEDGINNPKARLRIEAYNEAYQTLAPDARHFQPPPMKVMPQVASPELIDRVSDWLRAEGQRTRERWADRLPEIGALAVLSVFLMVLGLGAGAPVLLVFIAWIAMIAVIWAPWREPKIEWLSTGEHEDSATEAPREKLAS
jgi:hypothetical protein